MPNSSAPSSLGKRLVRFFGCNETGCIACFWRCVHEFALFLWVARAPFGVVAVGYLLLGAAPQAQDLLIPLVDSSPPYVLLFFVLHFLFWAMPVHYSARILLSDDKRLYEYGLDNPSPYFDWLERWIPRLLGAVTFLALIMSAYRANSNLPNIKEPGVINTLSKHLYYFMGWSVVGFVVFLNYTAYRTKMAEWIPSSLLDKLTSLTRPLLNLLDIGGHRSARPFKPNEMNPNDTGLLLLIFVFVIFVIVLLAAPNQVAERLPLAFSVSLMLGGWVPILTYLSAIGRRLQAPLIIGALGAVAILTTVLGDNHDVRLIEGSTAQVPMSLNQALSVWMNANNCTPEKAENCPRPIIVAASGGASRAGFFTVSVLGELLDKASKHGLDATELRKRLLAISSVSGSSVGAVMTVAALAAGGKDTHFPCRPDRFLYWYGDKIENWRGCLESLMTGDFITPTFIGLAFHDMIPFGPWHDRATIIEQSWERRFTSAMQGGERPCPADLKCSFYSLQPTKDLWLPILVLNGVSVTTGQRIITTLLEPKYAASSCPSGGPATACPLFAETWPFHDFLHDETPSSDWRAWLQRVITGPYLTGRKNNDIRLSTAAHNSARFPIVSPPGNIRNQAHYIVDRIVDGGYLENFGVLAAFELAQAVHAVSPELKPFVLVISNDPNEPVAMVASPDKAGATGFLTDLTSLVAAIANTRDARGSLAVEQLRNLSLSLTLPKCKVSFAHIRVWPERVDPYNNNCTTENFSKTPRAVSLSWWLSTPIQFRLFEEIEGPETCNKSALEDVWKAIPMKSGCLE